MAKNTYANDRRHGGRHETSWRGDNVVIETFRVAPRPVGDNLDRHSKEMFVGWVPYIDRLAEVAPLGYSLVFPIAEHRSLNSQRSSLYLTAKSRRMKIKIEQIDTYRLLLTLLENHDPGPSKKGAERVTWRRYLSEHDFELVPTVQPSSFIHDEDHVGYVPFIDKLTECGPLGYGVIYKMRETCYGCTEALQRSGLYKAAKSRGVWISIEKHGEHELWVYWKGSDPYASEHHQGVRRQHVRDDDESVAARFARAADWDYRT